MAERSYFYDSTDDKRRRYQAADMARFHHQIIGDGVSNSEELDNLEVTAKKDMKITLGAGYMFHNGYMYENDTARELEHDIAEPSQDRIDRVVIRFDNNPEQRENRAEILKGTPASSPNKPELTQDHYIYDISVASVYIHAGKSFIEDKDITDERADDESYIDLHNIYRGMKVSPDGVISFPNQSYTESTRTTSQDGFVINDREEVTIPIQSADIDRQSEVKSNDIFVPKTAGAYIFTAHVAFDEGVLDNNSDVQILFSVNDSYQSTLVARQAAGDKDNIYDGVNIQYLEAGDELRITVQVLNAPDGLETRNHRVRIAKIS